MYDIPSPQEKTIPPEAEDGEARDKPISEINPADRRFNKPKPSSEVATESVNKDPVPNGLVIEKSHVLPSVIPTVIEKQQPQEAFVPVAKTQNEIIVPGKKILEMEDRIFEKKTQIQQIDAVILQKEEDLQNAISNEDYDRAHELNCAIVEQKSKRQKLLEWIEKHTIDS